MYFTNRGIADELDIDLQNFPAPPPGESYYAWLLKDVGLKFPLLIGRLPVDPSGSVHWRYQGDRYHTNLISFYSRFLITEDDVDKIPSVPARKTWRFYTSISQASASESVSVLSVLRYLLSGASQLEKLNLSGGLAVRPYENVAKILEWSTSARGDWDTKETVLLHRHIVRILDYLDGLGFVQRDVSPNTPVYVSVRDAKIGLRELAHGELPPSFLYLLKLRLNSLAQVHGLSSYEVSLIQLAVDSLKSMTTCLDHVYQDAKQLVPLTFDQLLQPSSRSILNDMFIQALCAFGSQPDPLHLDLTAVGGISTVFDAVQLLAAFRNLGPVSSTLT